MTFFTLPPTVLRFKNGNSLTLTSAPGWPSFTQNDIVKDLKALSKNALIICLLEKAEMEDYYRRISLLDIYRRLGAEVISFPIEDMWIPEDLDSFVNLIKTIHKSLATKNVVIHCAAGMGRTGMVTAALFIKALHMETNEAIQKVRSLRPGAVESKEQVRFLRLYEEEINNV